MKLGKSDVEKLRFRLRRRKPHDLEMNWTECNIPYVEKLILERGLCENFVNYYRYFVIDLRLQFLLNKYECKVYN